MKKGYVFLTVVFIMGILAMTSGQAAAGWATTMASKGVLSNANPASLYQAMAVDDARYLLGGTEAAMAVNSVLTLTLTGGAVWGPSTSLPTVTCTTGGVTFTSFGSPAGTSTIQFLSGTTTAAVTLVVNTSACGINLLNATSNVDLVLKLETPTGTVITPAASLRTAADYLFQPKPGILVTNTVKEPILDVMALPAYSKFENGSLYGGASGLSVNNQWASAAGTIPNLSLGIKKVLITLTGDFAGITKITIPYATAASTYTGCDSALVTTSGLPGQFLINAAKTAAYVTNAVALPAGSLDCAPNFYVDGTTVQASRYFTASVENIVDSSTYVPTTWQTTIKNYNFLRNGTFFSANSLGTYNTVKISDLSGTVPTGGAKVLINAWDAAGVRLAEASGLTDILVQNNQTITLTGDQMAARFVGVAMKYEVAVQSKNAVISNVKKTPDGFGSNVYTNTPGGGAL